jgi:hypothetical protein
MKGRRGNENTGVFVFLTPQHHMHLMHLMQPLAAIRVQQSAQQTGWSTPWSKSIPHPFLGTGICFVQHLAFFTSTVERLFCRKYGLPSTPRFSFALQLWNGGWVGQGGRHWLKVWTWLIKTFRIRLATWFATPHHCLLHTDPSN